MLTDPARQDIGNGSPYSPPTTPKLSVAAEPRTVRLGLIEYRSDLPAESATEANDAAHGAY